MRVLSSLEGADRTDGRGAQSGKQAKKQSHAERECQAEAQDPPVGWKQQARWIVQRMDHADNERPRPPCEQPADRSGKQGEPRALYKHQLNQTPSSTANRDAH